MGRLGRLLTALDRRRLPVHVTPVVRSMIDAIAGELPAPAALPRPRLTDLVLDRLGDRAKFFDALLHNTASPTIVRGGHAANVIPGDVSVECDCRLLPGFGPEDVFEELRTLAGVEMELELLRHDQGPSAPDLALYDTLARILRDIDPAARPVPLLLPAVTDGRFFARLGIQTYGFLPMQLPRELRFMDLIHAEDERIPVEGLGVRHERDPPAARVLWTGEPIVGETCMVSRLRRRQSGVRRRSLASDADVTGACPPSWQRRARLGTHGAPNSSPAVA